MKEKDIMDAYIKIRRMDNTIPDEVLEFMKDCAIEKIFKSGGKKCKHSYEAIYIGVGYVRQCIYCHVMMLFSEK